MSREYVPIFFDWPTVTRELNAQEKGRLIDAIVAYATGEDWQEQIKGNERYVFPGYQVRVGRWNEISDSRSQASKSKQTETNENKTEQTKTNNIKPPKGKDKVKEKEKEKDIESKAQLRFSPPTVDMVSEYCRERGNRVDAQRFVDFYAAKGWKIGQNAMKDWKAAVRTWEQRDGVPAAPAKTVSAQQYTQRDYTEEELLAVSDDLFAEVRSMKGA